MSDEALFYQQLRNAFHDVHFDRIENSLGSGIFDVNATWASRDVWMELKVAVNGLVLMRPAQVAWSLKRYNTGARNLFVVAKFKEDRRICVYGMPLRYMQYGKYLKLVDQPMASFNIPFDWDRIKKLLFSSL